MLLGQRPPEVEAWLERRRRLGHDLFDEVWEGEYHVAPAPHSRHGRIDDQLARLLGPRADAAGLHGSGPLNLGNADDYRVPDRAYLRSERSASFESTAAIVVEIASPDDETREKLGFYFAVGVEELVIVDPLARTVEWFARGRAGFEPSAGSELLALTADEVTSDLDWPS